MVWCFRLDRLGLGAVCRRRCLGRGELGGREGWKYGMVDDDAVKRVGVIFTKLVL